VAGGPEQDDGPMGQEGFKGYNILCLFYVS